MPKNEFEHATFKINHLIDFLSKDRQLMDHIKVLMNNFNMQILANYFMV